MAQQQHKLRLTPKQQAIHDLEAARNALGEHLCQAAEELNPRTMVRRSMQEHRWMWMAAAGVAGLGLVRLLMPARRKFERDNAAPSATKSGLIALILTAMLGMARRAALNFATQHAKSYLHQYLSRHEGERPSA
ncbi:MAG: hypothetical protein U0984_17185 [Prosthecobacter sp.]|nr:hypothetical protein [Prosthecobacter sp.]